MDNVSPAERSRIMASVRSKGNKSTELLFISRLRSSKLTGWRRNYALLGKPDFVFPEAKLAIFLDGCFWHGCPRHCRMPSSNKSYWTKKIQRNRTRDRKINKELRKAGWCVVRVWEHEIGQTSLKRKLKQIETVLAAGHRWIA